MACLRCAEGSKCHASGFLVDLFTCRDRYGINKLYLASICHQSTILLFVVASVAVDPLSNLVALGVLMC